MISPETVAAVKERTDIVALINENVRLTKRGRSFLGLCPFHKEKTPSFSVNQERGFFHCFGCKESGSAIDYLMKMEGLTFPEAVRSLAERCGVHVEETTSDVEQREATRRRRQREQLYALNDLAASFFEQQLRRHPLAHLAHQQLAGRGMPLDTEDAVVREALAAFRIGYAPYSWDALSSYLERQGTAPQAAEQLGLVAPRPRGQGRYDRFRHRLMFPVLDVTGRVVAFSGRALDEPNADELAAAGAEPLSRGDASGPAKYINSPESPIYSKRAVVFGLHQARHSIRQAEEAVLVEGNFDVLALHARGLTNVAAPLGTAFTVEQAKLLRRYGRSAVLLFDADTAGRKAVAAAREPCTEGGLTARVATLPAGTDPDDHARAHGVEAVRKLVGAARGMLDYLIDEALGGEAFRGGSLRDKHGRIQAVAALLASEKDPSLRAMAKSYADRISSQLVVDGSAPGNMRELERLVADSLGGRTREPRVAQPGAARSEPRVEDVARAVLGALLDFPELLEDPEITDSLGVVEGEVALGVAAVRQMWDPKKTLQASELLDLMPGAIHPFAASRLASPRFEQVAEARSELFENVKKLRRLAWSREKAAMVDEISRAEGLGDSAAEDELLRELSRRSRQKQGLK